MFNELTLYVDADYCVHRRTSVARKIQAKS